jgi:hypothetical protein
MIFATLRPEHPVMALPGPLRHSKPIMIHGLRDADGPASGEPIQLMLDQAEARALIQGLQAVLEFVPEKP